MHNEHQEQRPVCYACGNAVEPGVSMFCAKRLRVARKAKFFEEEHVLEAVVSLQVCQPCFRRAAEEILIFQIRPLPLLDLEKHYFHNWAAFQLAMRTPISIDDMAQQMKEPIVPVNDIVPVLNWCFKWEERMECHECHREIEVGENYAIVQLVLAKQYKRGFKEKPEFVLRLMCDGCAVKMGVFQEADGVRRLAIGAPISEKTDGTQ